MALSAEQQRKIEQNKAAALLKKQQFNQAVNSSLSHNLTTVTTSAISKQNLNKNKFQKEQKKNLYESKEPSIVSITFTVISQERFIADMGYHVPSIEIFKTIPGRLYDATSKRWTFPLSEHSNLVSKLRNLNPKLIVNSVPDMVLKSLAEVDEPHPVNWYKIDKTLRDSLMPFQVEGVRFGIGKRGKCLIADDMGLGKTIQALGIACHFKENWPLLIVCPSSMKFPWQEAIKNFLPNVNPIVSVLTSSKDAELEGDIVITSYDLMKNCCDEISKKKFGVIIFDESHSLKSPKSARTKVALNISKTARNIILLSGTPALSRPQELYSQIFALDPYTFHNFYDFGIRYCNGKKDKFGWNFSGSSNLEELEVYLKKKVMIRRLKSEVLTQLPAKIRKVVILDPNMVKTVKKKMLQIESEFEAQKGAEKHNCLLSYYYMTGIAKLKAVCEYIDEKLENENKFLVFAHHTNIMDGISDFLKKKGIDFIRIDGSVNSEERQKLCNKFQNEKNCKVAVLSLKAANCGITLTEAQLVIFAELYWNPGELTQAEDRAHRIGQQDSVLVEYLVAKGTADDHLWSLVQCKLNILNKVGLSKDNFKEANTEHMRPSDQPTIEMMFEKLGNKSNESEMNEVQEKFACEINEEIKNIDNEMSEEMKNDDDIFESINLEEIENDYQVSTKKRKTSSD